MKLGLGIAAALCIASSASAQQPRLAGDTSVARVLVETWKRHDASAMVCLYGKVAGDTIFLDSAKPMTLQDNCDGIGIAGFIENENAFDRDDVLKAMSQLLLKSPYNVVATVYGTEPVQAYGQLLTAPRMWAALRPGKPSSEVQS